MESYGAVNGSALNELTINEGAFVLSVSVSTSAGATATVPIVRWVRFVGAAFHNTLTPDVLARQRRSARGVLVSSSNFGALLKRRVSFVAKLTASTQMIAFANTRLVTSAVVEAGLAASASLFWKYRLPAPRERVIRLQKQNRTVAIPAEKHTVRATSEFHKVTVPADRRVVK